MAQHKPKEPTKPCRYCGTLIHWTRNTSAIWERVLYCDNACKRMANRKMPQEIDPNANLKGPNKRKKR